MDKSSPDKKLAGWMEGELSEEESRELLAQMRNDSELRSAAAKHLIVKRLLAQQAIPSGDFTAQVLNVLRGDESPAESLTGGVIDRLQRQRRRQRRIIRGSVAVAAAAVVLLAASLLFPPTAEIPSVRVVAAEGVGTLDFERLERGGAVELQNGILELELSGDTRVVFEAPATFNILSPRHIRLTAGRCFAEGGSGLRIETPSGEALDLGTRFGVEVLSPRAMEVHVFDGAVEVSDSQGATQLVEGQGLILEGTGTRKELSAQPAQFVSHVPRPVESRKPILYWGFNEESGDRVFAKGRAADAAAATGVLRSEGGPLPAFAPGVFGTALEFDGKSQWVSTEHFGVSGDQDRTVACWVKLPGDWKNPDRAPILSWGLVDSRQSGKGWMLSVTPFFKRHPEYFGRLRLSVGEQQVVGTTDLRDGRWHHVAAIVAGGENGPAALLYVDGKLENVTRNSIESVETETSGQDAEPIRFGRQIFWDDLFMRGALDEVYLFDAALSGDQVRSLMQGKPFVGSEI